MFLRNKRAYAVEVPDLERDTSYWFDAGAVGEVPNDALAESLLEQVDNWEKAPASASPYSKMKKPELVAEADKRGLDTSGGVTELRERLTADDSAQVAEEVADEQAAPVADEAGPSGEEN